MRREAGLDRDTLVYRLADEIGHPEATDRIAGYYHQLEWGNLPATGVNRSVVEALARILETDPDDLYESGTAGVDEWARSISRSRRGPLPKRVFARLIGDTKPIVVDSSAFDPPKRSDWDETDTLFLGG